MTSMLLGMGGACQVNTVSLFSHQAAQLEWLWATAGKNNKRIKHIVDITFYFFHLSFCL